jgi:predicted ATPase
VPDAGGGYVGLALKRADLAEPIPASNLSDGQLAWLAFVALARLNPGRSLLAVDEPEQHLHPSLLGRVVTMLASLPGGAPVVLSTHSDRVLELLDDPADAVRVCSLVGSRADVSRIDAGELPRWLQQFGDLGQLRAAGYLSRVLVPPHDDRVAPTPAAP